MKGKRLLSFINISRRPSIYKTVCINILLSAKGHTLPHVEHYVGLLVEHYIYAKGVWLLFLVIQNVMVRDGLKSFERYMFITNSNVMWQSLSNGAEQCDMSDA